MKISSNYKKSFSLVLLTILVGCTTATTVSWTDPTVLSTFMKVCNPSNESGMQTICQCTVDKIKVKYPDASKADSIPTAEIEALTKECIK